MHINLHLMKSGDQITLLMLGLKDAKKYEQLRLCSYKRMEFVQIFQRSLDRISTRLSTKDSEMSPFQEISNRTHGPRTPKKKHWVSDSSINVTFPGFRLSLLSRCPKNLLGVENGYRYQPPETLQTTSDEEWYLTSLHWTLPSMHARRMRNGPVQWTYWVLFQSVPWGLWSHSTHSLIITDGSVENCLW